MRIQEWAAYQAVLEARDKALVMAAVYVITAKRNDVYDREVDDRLQNLVGDYTLLLDETINLHAEYCELVGYGADEQVDAEYLEGEHLVTNQDEDGGDAQYPAWIFARKPMQGTGSVNANGFQDAAGWFDRAARSQTMFQYPIGGNGNGK